MTTYTCLLPMIPIRREPAHKSEQLSQLIFGERADIIESEQEWVKIRTCYEGYEGWMELNSLTQDETGDKHPRLITREPFLEVIKENARFFIPAGAEIPYPDEAGNFQLADNNFHIQHNPRTDVKQPVEHAKEFLGAPYLWGGRTAMGIDCSGFSQLLFKISGIRLLRDASQQAGMGTAINSLDHAIPNDLLFFSNEKNAVTHVGLFLEDGLIIHASGSVRIDKIDSQGIYREDIGKYTHRLHSIRRLLS